MQRAMEIPLRHVERLKWNQDKVDVVLGVFLLGLALYSAVGNGLRAATPVMGVQATAATA